VAWCIQSRVLLNHGTFGTANINYYSCRTRTYACRGTLEKFVGNVMIVGHNQAYEQEGPSYWLALCRSVLRNTTSASKIIALKKMLPIFILWNIGRCHCGLKASLWCYLHASKSWRGQSSLEVFKMYVPFMMSQ
jgi:hypothetical protein